MPGDVAPDDRGFAYEPRETCVCGQALAPDCRVVTKQTADGTVTFRRCAACGSYVQSPQIEEASLRRLYESDAYWGSERNRGATYLGYEADEPARRREAAARYARDLAPLLAPASRILEIGCATGSLLRVLREYGHDASGVDVSARMAAVAREINDVPVVAGDVLAQPIADDSLDAVILLGTISNLPRPQEHLARIRQVLRPGGLLYFNYPAANALVARLYGRRFWMFAPSVSAFLSDAGCARLLDRAGFGRARRATDRQRPSLKKLLGHAGLGSLAGGAISGRAGGLQLPVDLPIPGVRVVWARRR